MRTLMARALLHSGPTPAMFTFALALAWGAAPLLSTPLAAPLPSAALAAQDLRTALDVLVARRTDGSTPLPGAELRTAVADLFENHLKDGGSPVEIATTWGSWTRALLATAGDASVPAVEVERALAHLEVAFDLGYEPVRAFVVRPTVEAALSEGLGANLDAALAVPVGSVDTASALERHLGPLRRLTARAPEPARAALAGCVAPRLTRALEREREHVVAALLDGRLAPLHAGLRQAFIVGLTEDSRGVERFDRHAVTLGIEAEPLGITRARLGSAAQSGDWSAVQRGLGELARLEALTPALHDSLLAAARTAVDAAWRGAPAAGLGQALSALEAVPADAGRVAALRAESLALALGALAAADDPAQLAAVVERAGALGVPRAVAIDGVGGATAGRTLLAARTFDALLSAAPNDGDAARALEGALSAATEAGDLAPLAFVASLGARHSRRFAEVFPRVRFERAPGAPDPAALDLYLAHERLLEPGLTQAQRAALAGPCAGLVDRRRVAAAWAAGDTARITALVAAGVDEAALVDVWRIVTETLATADHGAPEAERAATLAKELQRLGRERPATVGAVVEARVARAVERQPEVLRRELALAVDLDFVERSALFEVVQRELRRSALPAPAAFERLDLTRRALEADWSAAAALVEALAARALSAGEDPVVDRMARTRELEGATGRALARWSEERVLPGHELLRGVRFAARAAEAYPGILPALLAEGRLAAAVRAGLVRTPPDAALEDLALAHGELLGLSRAERVAVSRGALQRVTYTTEDIDARLGRHLALEPGDTQRPEVLRAGLLAAAQAKDWDTAFKRLAAARSAGALTAADEPLVTALDAERARAEAELEEYKSLQVRGAWSVVLTVDERRVDDIQRAEVSRAREGAVEFLRCKLSGAGGDLGSAYSTLYDPVKRTLTLKFQSAVKLGTALKPVMELKGSLRLVEPKGTVFEWRLEHEPGAPVIVMLFTRV